jgi:hypothetical protein
MSDLPKPIAYVTEEGGYYQRWVPTEIYRRELEAWRNNFDDEEENPATARAFQKIPRNARAAHAIFFDDGSVFDMVNGWRVVSDGKKRELAMGDHGHLEIRAVV